MNIFDLLAQQEQSGQSPQGPEALADDTQTPPCSRKGCREDATMQLLWNNPKIHPAERRKIWLACSEHVRWLEDYLQSRSLWKETLPLSPKDSA